MNFLCLGCILVTLQLSWNWWLNFLIKAIGFGLCAFGAGELSDLCVIQAQHCGAEAKPDRVSRSLSLERTAERILGRDPGDGGMAALQGARLGMLRLIKRSSVVAGVISALGAGWMGLMAAVWPPEKLVSVEDGSSRLVYNAFGLGGKAELISAVVLGIITTVMAIDLAGGVTALIRENDSRTVIVRSPAGEKKDKRFHFTLDPLETGRLAGAELKLAVCMWANMVFDLMNRLAPWENVQLFAGFMAVLSKLTLYAFVILMGVNFNRVRVSANKKYDSEYPISQLSSRQ